MELDYYSEILDFYEEISGEKPKNKIKIEKWSDISYIELMNALRNNKRLKDADIKLVAKNSMILILNLFDEKIKIDTSKNWNDLDFEEKEKFRRCLISAL